MGEAIHPGPPDDESTHSNISVGEALEGDVVDAEELPGNNRFFCLADLWTAKLKRKGISGLLRIAPPPDEHRPRLPTHT